MKQSFNTNSLFLDFESWALCAVSSGFHKSLNWLTIQQVLQMPSRVQQQRNTGVSTTWWWWWWWWWWWCRIWRFSCRLFFYEKEFDKSLTSCLNNYVKSNVEVYLVCWLSILIICNSCLSFHCVKTSAFPPMLIRSVL